MNQVDKNQLMSLVVNEIQRHSQQNMLRFNLMQQASANQQHVGAIGEVAYWLTMAAVNTPGCTDPMGTMMNVIQDVTRCYGAVLAMGNQQVMADPNMHAIAGNVQQDTQRWQIYTQESQQIAMRFQMAQQQQMAMPQQMNMLGVPQQVNMMAGQQGWALPAQHNQPQIAQQANRSMTFGAPNARPSISGDPMAATRKTIGGKNNSKVRRVGYAPGAAKEVEAEVVVPVAKPVEVAKAPVLTKDDWRANPDLGIMYLKTFDEQYGYERFHRDAKGVVFQEVISKGNNMSDQDYARHKEAFMGTRYALKNAFPENNRNLARTVSQVRKAVEETVRQQQQFVEPDGVVDLTDETLAVQAFNEVTHVGTLQDAFLLTRGEHLSRMGENAELLAFARTVMVETLFELDTVPAHKRENDYNILADVCTQQSMVALVESLKNLSDEFKLVHMPLLERMLVDEINYQLGVGFSFHAAKLTDLFNDVYVLDQAIRERGGVAMFQKWKECEPSLLSGIFCPPTLTSESNNLTEVVTVDDEGEVVEDARGSFLLAKLTRMVSVARISVHRNDLNFAIDGNPYYGRAVAMDNAPFLVELISKVIGNAMWAREHTNYYIMTMDGFVVRVNLGKLASTWLISQSAEQLRA